jgi:DNA polymerase-3 subunit gamma/tau
VKFIFCTTEPHRLPETIHSRCQRFDFRRISTADLVHRLEQICRREDTKADPEAIHLIARSTKGGMRDAETLLDQLTSYSGGKITTKEVEEALGALPRRDIFALIDHLADRKPDRALMIVHRAIQDGKDPESLLNQLIDHVRSLLILSVCGREAALLDETPEDVKELERQRQRFSPDALLYMSQVFWDTLRKVKESAQSRLPIELALVKLGQGDGLQPLAEILQRLQGLEARLGVAPAAASSQPSQPRPVVPAVAGPPAEPGRPAAPAAARREHGAQENLERAAEEHGKLQEQAADDPLVRKARDIFQGTVLNREK